MTLHKCKGLEFSLVFFCERVCPQRPTNAIQKLIRSGKGAVLRGATCVQRSTAHASFIRAMHIFSFTARVRCYCSDEVRDWKGVGVENVGQ